MASREMKMRRVIAILSALVLILSVSGASVTAAHERQPVNHFEGSFELLDWDGTLVGRVHADFQEPTDREVVPGTFDVQWVGGTRIPFDEQEYGVDESHAQLVSAFFGPNDSAKGNGAGASGYICDYSAPWNASCHAFSVVLQKNVDGLGTSVVGFVNGAGENYDQWYMVGRGSFALTYVGPTGG
jgi:hypothetical protein